ncbi:hypothetical protein C8R44DRAFT_749569 [Mycena epipterygia]|nr:hypothetical protein C8R44DRAFT_749569 [Mycena epipterygia]
MIVYPTDFEYVEIRAIPAPLLPIPCFYWFRPLKDSYTTSEGFGQFRTPHNRHDESRSTFPHTYANLLKGSLDCTKFTVPDISRVGHRGTGRRRENVIGMVQCYKQLKVPLSRDGKDKEEYSAGTWKAYNNVEVQVRYQLQEGVVQRRPNDRAAWSEARPDPPSKLVVQEPRKRLRTRGIKTVNAQQNFWIQRKAQMSWSQWRNPAGIPRHKNNVNGGRSGSPKPLACAEQRLGGNMWILSARRHSTALRRAGQAKTAGGAGAPNPLVGADEMENGHDSECAAEVKMAPSAGKHPARTRRRGSGANRERRRSTKTPRFQAHKRRADVPNRFLPPRQGCGGPGRPQQQRVEMAETERPGRTEAQATREATRHTE